MYSQSLRVMVVDNDHPYSVILKKALIRHGHNVLVCNSAEVAFNYLQKEQFDIMLLDYKMEGINGMFGKKIDIPTIIITGYGSEEIYEETNKWGASEYFVKGEMDTVRLPVMVEQVYRKHQARRARLT